MNAFYTYCHSAGPLLCAFYDCRPKAIENRLNNILADIKIHPVIVPASPSSNPRPEIISYSKVRRMISSALYRPLVVFPSLAEALVGLEKGDGRPFVDLTSQGGEELPLCEEENYPEDDDPQAPTPEAPEAEGNWDATKAIMCTDARPAEGGVEEFRKYVETLSRMSKSAGATMSNMWMGCMEWRIKAKWQFRGKLPGSSAIQYQLKQVRMRVTLLIQFFSLPTEPTMLRLEGAQFEMQQAFQVQLFWFKILMEYIL